MTLAGLLEAFFTERLVRQRGTSAHTIAAYRDTFGLLLRFAQKRLGKPLRYPAKSCPCSQPRSMSSWSFHLTGSSRAHLREELVHRLGAERAVSLLGVVAMTAFGLHCETEGAREPEALHRGVPSLSADLCIREPCTV
jgi:hypothetical protein